jgi:uncharacterized coiled-coil protein SlyX
MTGLDYHQPPPRVGDLHQAQALIDQLWDVVSEQRGQIERLQGHIEQLEEQLRLNSGDSSKPPASDDARARAERRKRMRSGRKISFATQSPRGMAFRPMLLSVVATARNLGPDTWQVLRRVCTEGLQGLPITPLPINQLRLPKPE